MSISDYLQKIEAIGGHTLGATVLAAGLPSALNGSALGALFVSIGAYIHSKVYFDCKRARRVKNEVRLVKSIAESLEGFTKAIERMQPAFTKAIERMRPAYATPCSDHSEVRYLENKKSKSITDLFSSDLSTEQEIVK